jgi:exodeoxyribonuclease V alpha subunit
LTDSSQPITTLEGVLDRIVYANEDNAWSVIRLVVPRRREPVTAVGNLLGVQPGESLRLSGHWITDRKYGEQFRVDSYVTIKPATLVGIERYLGSGLVRGIGKVMAARLVKHFGLSTLDVIDRDPDRLTEVSGIGPVRSARIRRAWAEQRQIQEVMVFLQSHAVSSAYAVKIYKEYGDRAIAVVRDDPYRLAVDIFGIGFKTADRIAANLGIPPTSPRRAAAGVLHVLGELSDEGHVFSPRRRLIEEAAAMLGVEPALAERAVDELAREGAVVVEPRGGPADSASGASLSSGVSADSAVYLRSLHIAESGVAERLARLLRSPTLPIAIDIERAVQWFEGRAEIVLAASQRDAIRRAAASKVLVITGGPGTGKTTLVNAIIQILERKGRRILLAAPTGRAAQRLRETTGREAKTVHRLLEWAPGSMGFDRNSERPLAADVLILDEVSMIDTVLAYHILKALPVHCQLILVGDVDQLPSVGAGCVLRDVILSGAVEVVKLDKIFRQAEESLVIVNAHRVNRGEMPLLGGSGWDREADFFLVERDEPEEALATVKRLVCERIPARFHLDPIEDVQVLTPMHRGTLGAGSLNAELQALLNPSGQSLTRGSRTFRVGDKVMQIRNNYALAVWNGDIGRVKAIDEIEREVEVRYEDRVVKYDYSDLDELVLGYACSIHKSQGSEYPAVVIPLHTQHYVMLQRNLLYTAITRARRLVVLVGSRRALAIAVKNRRIEDRFTRLAERLAGVAEPVMDRHL